MLLLLTCPGGLGAGPPARLGLQTSPPGAPEPGPAPNAAPPSLQGGAGMALDARGEGCRSSSPAEERLGLQELQPWERTQSAAPGSRPLLAELQSAAWSGLPPRLVASRAAQPPSRAGSTTGRWGCGSCWCTSGIAADGEGLLPWAQAARGLQDEGSLRLLVRGVLPAEGERSSCRSQTAGAPWGRLLASAVVPNAGPPSAGPRAGPSPCARWFSPPGPAAGGGARPLRSPLTGGVHDCCCQRAAGPPALWLGPGTASGAAWSAPASVSATEGPAGSSRDAGQAFWTAAWWDAHCRTRACTFGCGACGACGA